MVPTLGETGLRSPDRSPQGRQTLCRPVRVMIPILAGRLMSEMGKRCSTSVPIALSRPARSEPQTRPTRLVVLAADRSHRGILRLLALGGDETLIQNPKVDVGRIEAALDQTYKCSGSQASRLRNVIHHLARLSEVATRCLLVEATAPFHR